MEVKIISEAGYDEALFGLGLSHGVTSGCNYEVGPDYIAWCPDDNGDLGNSHARYERMESVAQRLAGKGNGHDKFLRQIIVWLDCVCPRYFWPELDQYKVATVTQSESTMHTICNNRLHYKDFDCSSIPTGYMTSIIKHLNILRETYNVTKDKSAWKALIQLLPQSYLQRRILTCSYATLRNIIEQRRGHKLSEWAIFIDAVREQCQHPELLP